MLNSRCIGIVGGVGEKYWVLVLSLVLVQEWADFVSCPSGGL